MKNLKTTSPFSQLLDFPMNHQIKKYIMTNATIIQLKNKSIQYSTFAIIALFTLFTACQKSTMEDMAIATHPITSTDASPSPFHVCLSHEDPTEATSRSVSSRFGLWEVGQVISIRFMGGSPYVQEQVKKYAQVWEQYANVQFDFVEEGATDIRHRF